VRAAWRRWRNRRGCFHHEHSTGESYLRNELIDCGMRKRFWCTRCGRVWLC
jgi:hypothetical protein